jgi:hypothetical protein
MSGGAHEDRHLQRKRRQRRLPVLLRWLEEEQPEIVCLQELKAPREKFPTTAIRDLGYDAIWHGQKSWNGVAILSRVGEIHETRRGLPGNPDPTQSRYIEAAVNGVIIGSLYLPNGNPRPVRSSTTSSPGSRSSSRTRRHCWRAAYRWCSPAASTSCRRKPTSTNRNAEPKMPFSHPFSVWIHRARTQRRRSCASDGRNAQLP